MMHKDTGAWTRRQIQKERAAREEREAARVFYQVTVGGEVKCFDTYEEARDWGRLLMQSPTACSAVIAEVKS